MMKTHFTGLILLVSALVWGAASLAAQETVTVPDVTGLNVPQAAAQLNGVGLRLGALEAEPLTEESAQRPGIIAHQSITPGEQVARGMAINVGVLTDARVRLVYDDNDFTMINSTDSTLSLADVVFNSADGTHRFVAAGWRGDLEAGDCTQIWSIARREPKSVTGCDSIYWLTTNNTSEHFWTQTAGVDSFTIIQAGVPRATCTAAPPNSQDAPEMCEFFVLTDTLGTEATDYVYFAYTTDRFAVFNNSPDRWMLLTNLPLYNYNPQIETSGASLSLADPALYRNPDTVADVGRLAPGQCLMLTVSPLVDASTPVECHLIAQRDLAPTVAFWIAPFELDSPYPGEDRILCPAATPGSLTICVMPRR